MADSASISPNSRPRPVDRDLGRRRLLAIGVAAPVLIATARASGGFTSSAKSPQLASDAIRTPASHVGTTYYFC